MNNQKHKIQKDRADNNWVVVKIDTLENNPLYKDFLLKTGSYPEQYYMENVSRNKQDKGKIIVSTRLKSSGRFVFNREAREDELK